ncbi:hypothetical protein DFH07DRAFT_1019380 [Mycena maculata]|uniref:Uncharacterized protein n=1 Tax=Mycena maculata TaxID=230809 RepID=A0AAD7MDP2_9AGAR|nr:hypothetical protein DFH07DRAFT_1019380 [Mycena maculata]
MSPDSLFCINSVYSPMKEVDAMISMLGGGQVCRQVCRRSIGFFSERPRASLASSFAPQPQLALTLVDHNVTTPRLYRLPEGSSMSDSSQSSIDMPQVNVILSNATHPMSSTAQDRVVRVLGATGIVAVYETIHELASPAPSSTASKQSSCPTACQGVFIVEPAGMFALRRYYGLRQEAEDTVSESKRTWSDTPFSVYALQAFQPPKNPEGMQALLHHSVQN